MGNDDLSELRSIWDEARSSIDDGNFDKAIEIYKYVLVRYSDHTGAVEHANAYLGDMFLTMQKLDLAEAHIRKAIDLGPENPGWRYILGFVYSRQRQWSKAIPEFEIAVAADPGHAEYLRGLGWVLYESGEAARGITMLKKAHRLAPDNASILTDLAVAHMSLGDLARARKYAETAVRVDPANPLAHRVLNKILDILNGPG